MELIVAIDNKNGIGYNGKLPWYLPSELALFKTKTIGAILVMGYNTIKTLPKLPNRDIICLLPDNNEEAKESLRSSCSNKIWFYDSLEDILAIGKVKKKTVFIAGGAETYRIALATNYVEKIHLSIIKNTYECDTFFDTNLLDDFVIIEKIEYNHFNHYTLSKTSHGERQYLKLMDKILLEGKDSIGRNGKTRSLFVEHCTFDLRNGFPLLTTKKMFLRGILEEFLFFIKGSTDSTLLSTKNVHIWDGNTSKEFITQRGLPYSPGIMGPMYGYQWRHFGAEYKLDKEGKPLATDNGIDQLANVIHLIKNDPNSRRILLTTYNPSQAEEGVLYPCHSISIQFYVDDDYLDMFCFNRSQDTFLGVPYKYCLFRFIIDGYSANYR